MYARIEIVPDRRIGIGGPARIDVDARDALQIGERRHVHDGHARHLGFRDGVQQFAHAGRAVLRLLHRQRDQIVVRRVGRLRPACGKLSGHLARVEFDQALASLHRHAHTDAFGINEIRLGRQADQLDRVPGEQQLGAQQGPVGSTQDQDLVFHKNLSHHMQ